MGENLKKNFKKEDMGFGIYYDDPKKVVDKKMCRMVGGIVLSDDEVDSEYTK